MCSYRECDDFVEEHQRCHVKVKDKVLKYKEDETTNYSWDVGASKSFHVRHYDITKLLVANLCQTIKQGQGSLGPQESVTSKDLKINNNLFKRHVNPIQDKLGNMDISLKMSTAQRWHTLDLNN